MASDSNGVYTLPDGYLAETGKTILASQHNPPLEDLAEAMSNRLPLSGNAAMKGPLKGVVGTVDLPSFSFSGTVSTGFYKTADGVGVSVNGVKVAEFTGAGILKSARYIGELIPFTGLTPPPLTVFPYGQTLSRTTYTDLWAFAQTEIAAGNSLYNNGNGVDTFGILDMRGRVAAGKDDMGGSVAGRLTSAGAITGTSMGYGGGSQFHQLTAAQIPTIIAANGNQPISVTSSASGIPLNAVSYGAINGQGTLFGLIGPSSGSSPLTIGSVTSSGNNSISVSSTNTSGQVHNIIQPTIITTYALFAGK